MTTIIWHNPRCSKSRLTLALLEEQGIGPVVRLYLEDAPSLAELELVVGQLGMSPWELLRRGEKIFRELGLTKESGDHALLSAMSQHPILIERPIALTTQGAVIGRPPENVLTLL